MDNFNVPKKVNRHVLKALNLLSDGNFKQGITTSRICNQVKYQMRNLVPVPDVEHCIQKSLKNLSEIGLIERQGHTRYCIGRNYAPTPVSSPNQAPPDKRVFRIADNRNRSKSTLDPNLKRTYSEDSLSGDDFDKTRKRMRSNNKQLRYVGRNTILPRARQHCRPATAFENNMPLISHIPGDNNNRYTEGQTLNGNGHTKNSTLEFILATVTPVPSLKIMEITEGADSTNSFRDVVGNSSEINDDIKPSESEVESEPRNSAVALGSNSETDSDTAATAEPSRTDHDENETIPVEERPLSTLTYFN